MLFSNSADFGASFKKFFPTQSVTASFEASFAVSFVASSRPLAAVSMLQK